jgi:hypothetical protein
MGTTSTRTEDGRQKIFISSKPSESDYTQFTGVGDNGVSALISMTAGDNEKQVDLKFAEHVHIKEGRLWCSAGVPFGASADVEVINPVTDEVIGRFCRRVPLSPGWVYLQSDDSSEIPAGVKIRMEVYNATGIAPHDPPGDFKVAGILTLFRANIA